jgi:putative SbcD/Mre11-related phosphoesterase
MARVEPVVGAAAAVADCGGERALVVADVHAGIEGALRAERGVSIDSRAPARRERLLDLCAETAPDRLVVLGDLMHSIGGPGGAERGEIETLIEALPVPLTLVKGNHDGDVESWLDAATVAPGEGLRIGPVAFAHGHTWPAPETLGAETLCVGHEHPRVRLTDEVGGGRTERCWLRGPLAREPFAERGDDGDWADPELVVFPSFNELSGGTWVNADSEFLAPFLPAALPAGEAYLLDGTRLGDYGAVS